MRRNLKRFVSDTRWQHHRNGYILAPLPIAPVHETDTVLLPKGLQALKRINKQTGVSFKGAYLNLDGGFDAASNRKAIFNAGVIPNVKENPRNRFEHDGYTVAIRVPMSGGQHAGAGKPWEDGEISC